jgi:hypothetical protein
MPQVSLNLAYWLGLLIAVVVPMLVGLATTRVTSAAVKAVVLLFLTALNGFLVELSNHPHGYSLGRAVILWLVYFAISVAMHFGLYKPTGMSAQAQAFGTRRAVEPAPRN